MIRSAVVTIRMPSSSLEMSSSQPPRLGRPEGPADALSYADPRHAYHSPGFGAYEGDGVAKSVVLWPGLAVSAGRRGRSRRCRMGVNRNARPDAAIRAVSIHSAALTPSAVARTT